MSSFYGNNIRFSIFGQSHSESIGVVAEGLPYGFEPDLEKLKKFMSRRAPGKNSFSTQRKEADEFHILSGISNAKICGAPFAAVIQNTNAHSKDYSQFRDIPRPGHADYTAHIKYNGFEDNAGGGHFSGRLTAPLCLIGGICLQILETEGINIGAHIHSINGIFDSNFDTVNLNPEILAEIKNKKFPVIDNNFGEKMLEAIESARQDGDSVGGIIECGITGLPAGLGDPMFNGMENRIASIVFGIPAIKGIEFGAGFSSAKLKGSENNDEFIIKDGKIATKTNNHGGILGGITSGMPIIFRAAVKPTPSIFKPQYSVNLSEMKETILEIKGRHDPCIVPRAVPCIEAAAALTIYDALLDYRKQNIK